MHPLQQNTHLFCAQDVGSAPAPSDRAVTLHAVPERWYAAWVFTGHPTEADIVGRMESVRVRTRAEGTKPVCIKLPAACRACACLVRA